ncbi:MAG TPA: Do family serine endopeptidase [Vicinamibacterales bacterium]
MAPLFTPARQRPALLAVLLVVLVVLVAIGVQAFGLARAGETTSQSASAPAGASASGARAAPGSTIPIDATTFRRIAEEQTPAVVSIRTESISERPGRDELTREFFERFFGRPAPERPEGESDEFVQEGAGSGFIIDASGLILTNNHVVQGARRIEVGLFDNGARAIDARTHQAEVVGRDPLTDTALIRLTEKPDRPLTAARLGSSARMAPGDFVVAIGNPYNLAHTVTVGVISASERSFQNVPGRALTMLQTDAAINPGNSGGPLLNVEGEVIGISTAIFSTAMSGGNLGIGFAVPIDTVKNLMPQLREGKVTRGRIGVQVSDVPSNAARALGLDEPRGAIAAAVEPDGPAAKAGMKPGDVVVEYNGQPITDTRQLVDLVTATKPGTTVPVRVIRDGKPVTLQVAVEELMLVEEQAQPQAADDTGGFGLQLRDQPAGERRGPQAPSGPVVASIEPRSPAARAGLQPGDVILEVNRRQVRTAEEAAAAFRQVPEGGVALVLLSREGQELFVTVPRGR